MWHSWSRSQCLQYNRHIRRSWQEMGITIWHSFSPKSKHMSLFVKREDSERRFLGSNWYVSYSIQIGIYKCIFYLLADYWVADFSIVSSLCMLCLSTCFINYQLSVNFIIVPCLTQLLLQIDTNTCLSPAHLNIVVEYHVHHRLSVCQECYTPLERNSAITHPPSWFTSPWLGMYHSKHQFGKHSYWATSWSI